MSILRRIFVVHLSTREGVVRPIRSFEVRITVFEGEEGISIRIDKYFLIATFVYYLIKRREFFIFPEEDKDRLLSFHFLIFEQWKLFKFFVQTEQRGNERILLIVWIIGNSKSVFWETNSFLTHRVQGFLRMRL